MSTARNDRDESLKPLGLLAAALFALMVGTGYAISPHAAGAIDASAAEETSDSEYLASECVADGLAFSDCLIDY